MKNFFYLGCIALFLSILVGCGTLLSIDKTENYVLYARVNINDSLSINGQVVNINDSLIAISVNGAIVEYVYSDIIDYENYMAPNPELVQRDIAKNSDRIASNTGFFVGLSILSIIAALIIL